MYKIEIGNKTGEKRAFECDGTANIYALFRELNITDYPYRLKVGQNKNGVSVRILADNDVDAVIAEILTNNRDTLNDSLIVSRLLNDIKDETMQEEIERNALNDQYETKEDLLALLLKTPILNEFSNGNEDFDINMNLLDKYINLHKTNKGILLIRRYYGITAIK